MSKELKALENLWYGQKTAENYKLIKKALKKIEKNENVMPIDKPELLKPSIDIVNKKLKALEIIKEKKVDVDNLLLFVNLKYYNNFVIAYDDNKKRVLTKQEYDLLKEVLK